MQNLTIGTRGSDLALTQSRWVAKILAGRGVEAKIEIIRTQGDQIQDVSFAKMVGKGFFTKEIEEALLDKRVDLAVHSLKDLPTQSPPGLKVVAIPIREDPRDCLLIRPEAHDPSAGEIPLKRGATLGSGSVRRRAQLKEMRPDIEILDLRGNVPTRVRKLREQQFDATLIAQAGLTRLGQDVSGLMAVPLPTDVFVPAPGQGALALQVREEDTQAAEAVRPLEDGPTARRVAPERGLLARLEGGCQLPLGAHAVEEGDGGLALHVFFGGTEQYPGARRSVFQGDDPAELVERAYKEIASA